MSLSHPVLISVLFVLPLCLALSLFLSHCILHKVTLFSLFSKWEEKHLGDTQSRLAVKSLEHLPPFREILIENPGSEGVTNKLEMYELGMNTNAI